MTAPQPMDRERLADLREGLDDNRASERPVPHDLACELVAAHDYYRARCTVLPSDVGPEHTAARVLAYALASGWVRSSDAISGDGHYFHGERHMHLTEGIYPLHPAFAGRSVSLFCDMHALATGLVPLDVLDAIGALP